MINRVLEACKSYNYFIQVSKERSRLRPCIDRHTRGEVETEISQTVKFIQSKSSPH